MEKLPTLLANRKSNHSYILNYLICDLTFTIGPLGPSWPCAHGGLAPTPRMNGLPGHNALINAPGLQTGPRHPPAYLGAKCPVLERSRSNHGERIRKGNSYVYPPSLIQ